MYETPSGLKSKTPTENSQADDFYVFITDEEEKRRSNFKKGKQHISVQRVLGFWCFNAGVGFK